jgi:hypothetical protein
MVELPTADGKIFINSHHVTAIVPASGMETYVYVAGGNRFVIQKDAPTIMGWVANAMRHGKPAF